MPRWGWALIAACAVVMIGLVALGIWAAGGGATNTDDWITYTAPDGSFTAKFPDQPTVQTHRLDNGVVVRETMHRSSWGHWEVSWFDWHDPVAPFTSMIAELARAADAPVTREELRLWKGMTGYYAELADGLYKVQMIIAGGRLWTIAVFKQTGTFEFFLEKLELSDDAMGIEPLSIAFMQRGVAYEGGNNTSWEFAINGGRRPYKVSLTKPFADTEYTERNGSERVDEYHEGFSATATAGSHPVEASVTDVDGRTVDGKWLIEVHERIETPGTIAVALSIGLYDRTTTTNSIRISLGCYLNGAAEVVWTNPKVRVEHEQFAWTDLPTWLKRSGYGSANIHGTAEEVGVFTFKATSRVRLGQRHPWVPIERVVTVEVVPIPLDEVPSELGEFSVTHVSGYVGDSVHGHAGFSAKASEQWTNLRSWKAEVRWVSTLEEVTELLPKGVSALLHDPKGGSGASISLSGKPLEVFDQEIQVKLNLHLKYLPDPIELVLRVCLKIVPLPVPENVEVPTDALIRASAGRKLDTQLRYEVTKPKDWKAHTRFEYDLIWQIDDVVLPDGVTLKVVKDVNLGPLRLVVHGSIATPGEYTVEVPLQIKLRYTDKTYNLVQKIKIVIS